MKYVDYKKRGARIVILGGLLFPAWLAVVLTILLLEESRLRLIYQGFIGVFFLLMIRVFMADNFARRVKRWIPYEWWNLNEWPSLLWMLLVSGWVFPVGGYDLFTRLELKGDIESIYKCTIGVLTAYYSLVLLFLLNLPDKEQEIADQQKHLMYYSTPQNSYSTTNQAIVLSQPQPPQVSEEFRFQALADYYDTLEDEESPMLNDHQFQRDANLGKALRELLESAIKQGTQPIVDRLDSMDARLGSVEATLGIGLQLIHRDLQSLQSQLQSGFQGVTDLLTQVVAQQTTFSELLSSYLSGTDFRLAKIEESLSLLEGENLISARRLLKFARQLTHYLGLNKKIDKDLLSQIGVQLHSLIQDYNAVEEHSDVQIQDLLSTLTRVRATITESQRIAQTSGTEGIRALDEIAFLLEGLIDTARNSRLEGGVLPELWRLIEPVRHEVTHYLSASPSLSDDVFRGYDLYQARQKPLHINVHNMRESLRKSPTLSSMLRNYKGDL